MIESNAKIVQWSDGSYSLTIGEEIFDIQAEELRKTNCFVEFEKFAIYKGKIKQKMIVKPQLKHDKVNN